MIQRKRTVADSSIAKITVCAQVTDGLFCFYISLLGGRAGDVIVNFGRRWGRSKGEYSAASSTGDDIALGASCINIVICTPYERNLIGTGLSGKAWSDEGH